jgi:hypothetical protein
MDKFNAILQAAMTLFANLSPQFFHSAHGQAVSSEIQTALQVAAVAGVLEQQQKAQASAAKPV